MVTLNREQLYKWVWSIPVTKIAEELKISGSALAKKCRAHHIPTPGRGYWRQIEKGKPVERSPLPNPDEGDAEVPVKVSEDRAEELDQLPSPLFCPISPLVSPDVHLDKQAASKVVSENFELAGGNDSEWSRRIVNAMPTSRISVTPKECEIIADPVNIIALVTRYEEMGRTKPLFESLRAKSRGLDPATRAVLTLWDRATRDVLSESDPVNQIIEACRRVARGEENPAWWISIQQGKNGES